MPKKASEHRPNARKQPKQARAVETVKVITEAAARVLEAAGLEGFSTNSIADSAGVSVGSVYQYFPSKDALIGALIVRETASLITEAELALQETSGTAALDVLIRASIRHQFRRPELARVLDFEEARLPFDEATRQVADRFRAIVLDVLSRPDLPTQQNYDMAAQDVMAIIKGMIDTAGMNKQIREADLAERVGRAVWGYIGIK